jgi:predicted DNA-binding helix-hairpin-helix protein
MSGIDTIEKLEILAAAAKYDASCAPSGTAKKHSLGASDEGRAGCWARR